jgi:hypothetical protein
VEIKQMNQLAEQIITVATDQEIISAPRQVFLFSGHMIDAADRSPARFPPDKEPLAAAAIGKLLINCAQAPMMWRFLAALAAAIYSLPKLVGNADCASKFTCHLWKKSSSKSP